MVYIMYNIYSFLRCAHIHSRESPRQLHLMMLRKVGGRPSVGTASQANHHENAQASSLPMSKTAITIRIKLKRPELEKKKQNCLICT